MKKKTTNQSAALAAVMLLAGFCSSQTPAHADVCSSGTGLPPFLSSGAAPNLLLVIDNSGSMLDPAYSDISDTSVQCFDETYDNTTTYAGYFESTTWYSYDFTTDDQFELEAAVPAVCETADYYGHDASSNKFVCLALTTSPDAVTDFVATGNFMNWLAASKFDVQKKILTGGKYDDVNGQLQMESRGCTGRRFVKQVVLAQTAAGTPYKLTLGVHGPQEDFQAWLEAADYEIGDIVLYEGTLYEALQNPSVGALPTTNAVWAEYKDSRWYPSHIYPANSVVLDTLSDQWYWTQAGGTSAAAADISGDTAVVWVPYDGTGIDIFKPIAGGFDVGPCESAMAALGGLEGTDADEVKLGTLKGDTEECMGFDPGGGNTVETARKSSFNHAMQECWYYNKFGRWQPGGGTVSSMKSSCENVYEYMSPGDITPWDSAYACFGSYNPAPDKSKNGYVGRCWEPDSTGGDATCIDVACAGRSTTTIWSEGQSDYICSTDGTVLLECTKNNCNSLPAAKPGDWKVVQECTGGGDLAVTGWTNDDFYYLNPCAYNTCEENDILLDACPRQADTYTCTAHPDWTCTEDPTDGDTDADECHIADVSANGDRCVDQAIKDFCNIMSVPEVIDPSDSISITNELWNAPAFLVDGGVMGQLDSPLVTMKGRVEQASAPAGVLHDTADDLNIGAMAFNAVGSATECTGVDTTDAVEQYCPDANRDGGQVIAPIKSGSDATHLAELVTAINAIRANAWTPLAEAMYNALGYYGQKSDRRLNAGDFYTATEDATWPDPVEFWCQQNHILVITEGASTADINGTVGTFVKSGMSTSDDTVPADEEGECLSSVDADLDGTLDSLLYGSTYLDDLTYFGAHAEVSATNQDLYANPIKTIEGVDYYKQNILTHIVATGSLRDDSTTSECNPATLLANAAANAGTNLLTGENPAQLEDNLRATFSDILSRVSAGSAASVISSSRSGAGAVYQAIFWPQQKDSNDNEVTWVGDVHGIFLDSEGLLWEDSDQDRTLDKTTDKRVRFYFDYLVTPNRTRVCYDPLIYPEDTNVNGTLEDGEDTNNNGILDIGCASPVEIDAINYLWSVAAPNAGGWLSSTNLDTNITAQRPESSFISDVAQRYIFTWNDLNNDGIVDSNEQVDFTYSALSALTITGTRGPLLDDFAVGDTQELERLINWLRGADQADLDSNNDGVVDYPALRSRAFAGTHWRLGDVIHSTPTLVGRPLESYHFVYQDPSYALFAKKYAKRRNVVYFGANDGMLHAVNAGFFIESQTKFCLTEDCTNETGKPPLGAELWAYIPYNLQPHLKCLTDPNYTHKYYVDQRPRIFDVQIFPEDADHPGGWGTILVGSMRMGGTPVAAVDLNGDSTDTRQFLSSYFVLDITNPEAPPVLLGEMTATTDNGFAEFGYSTVSPAMVIMRDTTGATRWHLAFGNGPTTLAGENDQQGKVGVLPLAWLVGEPTFTFDTAQTPAKLLAVDAGTRQPFRIPNLPPDTTSDGGIFTIPAAASGVTTSFVSDLVSADYDVNSPATVGVGAAYKTDALYFGTVDGTGFEVNAAGTSQWNGGGRMFRLVTRGNVTWTDDNEDGLKDAGDTYTQVMTDPADWSLSLMLDAQEPVSTAPAIGWDGGNFWVYFGTGRFHDSNDKTDTQTQRFFGVKEPYDCATGELSWAEIDWWSGGAISPTPGAAAGSRGLMDVSDIRVVMGSGNLLCADGTTNCRQTHTPETITTFDNLKTYIVGERCPQTNVGVGLDGWFREFPDERERNLGQATLLGGLVTFSTYRPYADVCLAEGESFLYGVHYQTGTSWTKNLFGLYEFMGDTIVSDRLSLGKGLALTPSLHVGTGDADATAFVQTSTGEIIEISQEELPLGNFKSGRSSWRQE